MSHGPGEVCWLENSHRYSASSESDLLGWNRR
uniref:Uncharacterized protein n=1 Tax=Anguilla anguilla TaxID=7936 RepID=A0A0E9Y0V2_ANGAN